MFSQLIAHSSNAQTLSEFIGNNELQINEFVNSGIEAQRLQAEVFEQFVLLNSRVRILDSLDFSISHNRAFISILFDFAERVNAPAVIMQLYQIIKRHKLDIGSRLEAAMMYLYNIPNNQVYVERFDEICSKLQLAIDEEDDDDNKAVATFLNYYSSVVFNTYPHLQFAKELQAKARAAVGKYPFLQSEDITKSLSFDINQCDALYTTIQALIDRLLGKKNELYLSYEPSFVIESDSEYSRLLSQTPKSFDAIRKIAINQLASISDADKVYRSLGRGVAILEKENQLYSYLKSYGLMHKAKLTTAFSHFSFRHLGESEIEIIDWSCGQGMASMVLLEYLREHNIKLAIRRITLIEPSEIALKRASLHVRHFESDVTIKTVLKDIDSLSSNDIKTGNQCILHLFSNILDVEGYSMLHLTELIKHTFKGENYFICVSPYINDFKTARFDSFVNRFKGDSFISLYNDKATRGEWVNNWTKLISVFRTII